MSTSQTPSHQVQEHEVGSFQSRASSVVSTETKFSISTLPNDEHSQIGNMLGRSRCSTALRPQSVLSAISYDRSLPPYDPYDEMQSAQTVADRTNHSDSDPNLEPFAAAYQSQLSPKSPANDAESALSKHYGRVIRTIDQNHLNQMRRLKEAHQEELGVIWHAIGEIYQKELKAKDHEVERMCEEIASLKATHEATIASMQREVVERKKSGKRWETLPPRMKRLLLVCSEKSSSILRSRFKRAKWPLMERLALLKTFGKPDGMTERALSMRRRAKQTFNTRRSLAS